ncbi:MAG: hypothetical protein M5U26_23090 [Planctomycetota bacterium]|nr:hypothetical protein [Planctomycetota bacterium]
MVHPQPPVALRVIRKPEAPPEPPLESPTVQGLRRVAENLDRIGADLDNLRRLLARYENLAQQQG